MNGLAAAWCWFRLGAIAALLGIGIFVSGESYQMHEDQRQLSECRTARESSRLDAEYWQMADRNGRYYFNALASYATRPHPSK